MSSRRQFIRDTAIFTSGVLLASSCQRIAIGKKPTVIIIGAGFAGLAAALYLHKNNIDFILLEARNRIGGRVFSFTTDTPERFVIELGAEWIGDDHERLLELCDEFKLATHDNRMKSHLQYKGRYADPEQFEAMKDKNWTAKWIELQKAYADIPEEQRDRTFDHYDWWRYLKNNGCPDFDLDIRELADSTDFGESIRNVSAAAALSEYAYPGLKSTYNEMDKKIKGGNGLLANAIFNKVKNDNNHFIGDPVTIIEQSFGKKVKVTCRSGKVHTADKIICTVPTYALKNIDWRPGLPERVMKATDKLQYARINKHPVQFSKKFWKDDHFDMISDGPLHYLYHATIDQHPDKGILTAYSIGEKADLAGWNAKDDEWNKQLLHHALSTGFGDVTSLVEKQWNYNWGKDDYSFGAYAIFKPGQWKSVQQELDVKHIHTQFAGEHLADWQGFMEGAIVTGEKAAEGI